MEQGKTSGRFKKSLKLTQASWNTLKLDKELLTLPAIGLFVSIFTLAIAGLFASFNPGDLLYHTTSNVESGSYSASMNLTVLGYVGIFIIGMIVTGIAAYFNAAVIYGALERFKGNDPTVKSCMSAINHKLGSVLLFSMFSYTIGFIISEIANRIPVIGGQVVGWLAGAAWGVASFFAMPGIVASDTPVNPIQATKNSVGIMKKIWGESLIAGFAISSIEAVIILVYAMVSASIFVTIISISAPAILSIVFGVIAVIGLLMIAVVFSVLEALLKAALYHYATTGESPATFNQDLLRQAFTQKKARKVFGA